MAILDIRQRTGYVFVAVMLGHMILISAQVNTARGVPFLDAMTFGVFAEVQRASAAVVGGVQGAWEEYVALRGVRAENQRIRQENDRLRFQLQQEQALATQADTLRSLLGFKTAASFPMVAAVVIAGGASPDFRTVTINRGTRAGLRSNLAVLAPRGVVGRVITPGLLAAKVQLIIDRNAAVAALDERSRAQGIAVGTGGSQLRMEYVLGTADVKVGDRVVSSGLDGIYPKGFLIGQIESVTKGTGDYSSILVRPAVDFAALEDVLVILSEPEPAGEPEAGQGGE
jgi:rod shape-determining protein MreC